MFGGEGIQPSLLRWASQWHASLAGKVNLLNCIYSNATVKSSRSGPLAIFSFIFPSGSLTALFLLSLLSSLLAPALDHPYSWTNTGSKDWWYLLSSLALRGQSTAINFYSILRSAVGGETLCNGALWLVSQPAPLRSL